MFPDSRSQQGHAQQAYSGRQAPAQPAYPGQQGPGQQGHTQSAYSGRQAPAQPGYPGQQGPGQQAPAQPRQRSRRTWAIAAIVAGVVVVAGAGAGIGWASQTGHPAATAGKTPHVAAPKGFRAVAPAPSPTPAAPPVSLTIPAIGVQTSLIHLGIASDGTLQVPTTTTVAGWFTGSPRPGDVGASVIAGHVDSYAGPGVFFQLGKLRPGQPVYVKRADGSVAQFSVTSVQQFPKDQFPSSAVYGPVPDSELRLITCGGTFDSQTGHYLSNVIVDAVLDSGGTSPKA